MIGKRQFFKNGLLLAAVSLLMRSVSLAFNAFITDRVGAEGMGLLSLTMSVYAFAVTFATSGIALAVTRLVAEALGRGEGKRARKILRCALLYALCFGGVASLVLYFGSNFIALRLLGDIRTRSSLRLLSVSLVPIAFSSVYSGYFTAVRRVVHNAATQIFEQAVRMMLTVFGLALLLPKGVEYACLALVGGSAIAEFFSFFVLFVQAKIDLHRHRLQGGVTGGEWRGVCGTALPIAASAHVRSGLVTAEHLLIPVCLTASGLGRDAALASYAALHSMALPVVLFPTAILSSFAGLLIPECAELQGCPGGACLPRLSRLARRALTASFFFSIGAAAVLFLTAGELGAVIYHNAEAGRYIRLLAPLVPVMYMDSVVDAHLKGMGYQVYSMGVNIADAAMSVLAVCLLLPRFGADGYIYVIYLAEIFNFSFSFGRLRAALTLSLPPRNLILPVAAAAVAVAVTAVVFRQSGMDLAGLITHGLIGLCIYSGLLTLLDTHRPFRTEP